jgi:hypothetical protein
MQSNKLISLGNRIWNPYFMGGVIFAIFVIAKSPLWKPFGIFPAYPGHISVSIQIFALNALAFLMGYSLLRPFKTLVVWKFMIYLVVTTVIIRLLCEGVSWDWDWIDWYWQLVSKYPWFFRQTLPLFVSILLNINFLKYLFRMDTRSAILLGILLGIIDASSPDLSLPLYPFYTG